MTEIELIVDFHKDAERQGPGSVEDTIKALNFIDVNKNQKLNIADIGCGSGGQTITIAQNIEGQIFAVDLFPEFLEILNSRSEKLGLQEKITTVQASMEDLPFGKEEFDIIWSEGAIYNIGFEAGIKNWRNFLKKGGHLCVSDIAWITGLRPKEIEEYWKRECPEIDTAANKVTVLENNGFTSVQYFILAQSSWIDTYYKPMEKKFSAFLEKHEHSEMAITVVDEHIQEIKTYQKFKEYFSYGFYVAKKI